jgi:hypothetical protein
VGPGRRRSAGQAPPGRTPAPAGGWLRANAGSFGLVVAVAGLAALFYLGLYAVKSYPLPIGWDTPRYLAQANLVAAHGLTGVPHALPPPAKVLASRAGFPVIVLTLSSVFTVSPFKLAATVPVAATVALALAAGAFVSAALRRGAGTLTAVAAVVAVSPVAIRLMAPETYTDNLLAASLFAAALTPVLLAVRDGRGGVLAGAVLLGAGGIAHAPFFAVTAGALALAAAAYGPASWRSWRAGRTPWSTPSGRLLATVAGGGAVAAVGMVAFLRTAPDTPLLSPGELRKKLREDVGLYLFPVTAPLAAAGAAVLGRAARRGRSAGAGFALVVMVAWGAVLAGGVALFFAGANVPAHRFLAMLLPLPVLGAVAILAFGRWAGRGVSRRGAADPAAAPGRTGAQPATSTVVAGAVVAVAIAGLAVLGWRDLYVTLADHRGVEWLDPAKVQEAANAAAYLDRVRVPASRPVVFVVDAPGTNPLSNDPETAYIVRSALPAARIPSSWFYVGNPDRYLAGRPTLRPQPRTYDTNSRRFWRPLARMLASAPRRPVAVVLRSTNPLFDAEAARHPGWVVAPGVLVLQGPRPAAPLPAAVAPSGIRTVPQGVAIGGGTLALLALVGLGWAVALLPRGVRPFEVLALSPAVGIGFLLLGGIVLDAVGVGLLGWGGSLTVAVAGAVGFAVAWRRLRGQELAGWFADPAAGGEPQPDGSAPAMGGGPQPDGSAPHR